MKFSAPVLGLLLAIAPSAWAGIIPGCERYGFTDTEQQCFPLSVDPESWTAEAGTVCISVTEGVMSVVYESDGYYNLFNTQVFVGASFDDVPINAAGSYDVASFTSVSEEYKGGHEHTNLVDLAGISLANVAAQCADKGEYEMTIVPASTVGDVCDDPVKQGEPFVNWQRWTDFYATAGNMNSTAVDKNQLCLTMPIQCQCYTDPDDRSGPNLAPPKSIATGSGDPHFKTWTGDKFDYHGECDLVLVDNPSFDNGKGLKVHIRTTRIKYFSYIEKIAIQIGEDVLEFSNDVDNFLINGKPVEKQRTHHKTYLDRFVVRRDKKALSIRLTTRKQNGPKIDLIQRNIGWPAVIVNGGDTDMFAGSLGLLGEWETGKKIARDGKMEMIDEDATAFALEWQVRDTEPLLFTDARVPQFPQQCTPPAKVLGNRLGMKLAREEAAKACDAWKQDKDDCIFDVIATRDVSVATEGSIQTA